MKRINHLQKLKHNLFGKFAHINIEFLRVKISSKKFHIHKKWSVIFPNLVKIIKMKCKVLKKTLNWMVLGLQRVPEITENRGSWYSGRVRFHFSGFRFGFGFYFRNTFWQNGVKIEGNASMQSGLTLFYCCCIL